MPANGRWDLIRRLKVNIHKYVINTTLLNVNLTHNYFILQYVYYSPLHVSSNVVLINRRSNVINTASGIVTLSKWPPGSPDGNLQRVTIPNAVLIQFDLLMISKTLLETCRRL